MSDEKKKTTTTKKTNTKKSNTKKEEPSVNNEDMIAQLLEQIKILQNQVNAQKEVEVKAESVESEKWNKSRLYAIKDEIVTVRSVFDGVVVYTSPKTKLNYKWLEKGDIEALSIEEVLAMKKVYLETPWLVVEDERVIEGLGLGKVMDLVNKIEDIDTLVTMDLDDLEKLINGLTKDQRDNLRDEINKKIENNEIRDYVTVVTLKKILNLD